MKLQQETSVYKNNDIATGISNAETRATHYITDTQNGVMVHPEGDTDNYVLIQDGVEIYRDGDRVARYGDTVRIGKDAKAHIDIDNSKAAVYAGRSNTSIIEYGLANDTETGLATIEELLIVRASWYDPEHSTYYVILSRVPEAVLSCKVNGQEVTLLDVDLGSGIIASLQFQNGDVVTVQYTTRAQAIYFKMGERTVVGGFNCIAVGNGAQAYGMNTSAFGLYTTAIGLASFAEGSSSIANGDYSHAQNRYTIAQGSNQTALGRYNIADAVNAIILGNGFGENNRSNALTVDWNGNVTCGTVNGVDVTNISASIETITNWNTTYDSSKPVRYLFGDNATNTPASGAQIVGIEISNASNNRMQIAFRVGSGTSNSFFVRHAPSGTWGSWTEYGAATATVSTGITGLEARKNGPNAMLYFHNFQFAAGTGTDSTAYQLPAELRPAMDLDLRGSHNSQRFYVRANTGYIQPATAITAATAIRGTFAYLTA